MRFVWINIIAVIIAISSLVVERPAISCDFTATKSLTQIPHFSIEVLRNDSHQQQKNSLHVAQDFIPIVVLAYETNANHGYIHYISLFEQSRTNHHFLLL